MRSLPKILIASVLVLMLSLSPAISALSSVYAEDETITVTFMNGTEQFGETQQLTKGVQGQLNAGYPIVTGKVFLGWKTQADGGTYYYPGQMVTFYEDTVLYAEIGDGAANSTGLSAVGPNGEKVVELRYTGADQHVSFHLTQPDNTEEQDKEADGYFKIDTDEFVVTRVEWYVDARNLTAVGDQVGIDYMTRVSGDEWVKITYIWGLINVTFTRVNDMFVKVNPGILRLYYEITYDANGGEGEIDPQRAFKKSATLSDVVPTKEGMTFRGWATDPSATRAEYQPGEEIALDDNLKLYAVWEDPNPPTGVDGRMIAVVLILIAAVLMIAVSLKKRRKN